MAYLVAVLLMFLVGRVIVTAVTKETEDRIDGATSESGGGDSPSAGDLTPGPESAPGGSPAEGSPAIEGDGIHLLGEDLAPGRYVADPAESTFCFWEHHSGPEDTSGGQEHVIASGGPGDDRFLVEVAP